MQFSRQMCSRDDIRNRARCPGLTAGMDGNARLPAGATRGVSVLCDAIHRVAVYQRRETSCFTRTQFSSLIFG